MTSRCAKVRLYLSLPPGTRKCFCQCTAIMSFVTYLMISVETTVEAGVDYVYIFTFVLLT
jgi:hypothetical protein